MTKTERLMKAFENEKVDRGTSGILVPSAGRYGVGSGVCGCTY